jgi:diadenosine tetraphosphate (Ap4A) HIT family hydrolase
MVVLAVKILINLDMRQANSMHLMNLILKVIVFLQVHQKTFSNLQKKIKKISKQIRKRKRREMNHLLMNLTLVIHHLMVVTQIQMTQMMITKRKVRKVRKHQILV